MGLGILATPGLFHQSHLVNNTLIQNSRQNGLLEQWIEYDLAGRLNPYGLENFLDYIKSYPGIPDIPKINAVTRNTPKEINEKTKVMASDPKTAKIILRIFP